MKNPIPHNYTENNCASFMTLDGDTPEELIQVDPGLLSVLQAYRQLAKDLHETRVYAIQRDSDYGSAVAEQEAIRKQLQATIELRKEAEDKFRREQAKCANTEVALEKIRKHRDDLEAKLSAARTAVTALEAAVLDGSIMQNITTHLETIQTALKDTKAEETAA